MPLFCAPQTDGESDCSVVCRWIISACIWTERRESLRWKVSVKRRVAAAECGVVEGVEQGDTTGCTIKRVNDHNQQQY